MDASVEPSAIPSRKIADFPGGMLPTPRRATADANAFELSSIFQPERSTGPAPVLVTSNQSAAYEVSPLPHGATSEITTRAAMVPGEPISLTSFAATNAP